MQPSVLIDACHVVHMELSYYFSLRNGAAFMSGNQPVSLDDLIEFSHGMLWPYKATIERTTCHVEHSREVPCAKQHISSAINKDLRA
jgi:hypothetical protein